MRYAEIFIIRLTGILQFLPDALTTKISPGATISLSIESSMPGTPTPRTGEISLLLGGEYSSEWYPELLPWGLTSTS